jgi:hypothetical protein
MAVAGIVKFNAVAYFLQGSTSILVGLDVQTIAKINPFSRAARAVPSSRGHDARDAWTLVRARSARPDGPDRLRRERGLCGASHPTTRARPQSEAQPAQTADLEAEQQRPVVCHVDFHAGAERRAPFGNPKALI